MNATAYSSPDRRRQLWPGSIGYQQAQVHVHSSQRSVTSESMRLMGHARTFDTESPGLTPICKSSMAPPFPMMMWLREEVVTTAFTCDTALAEAKA